MKFRKRPVTIEAVQLTEETSIDTLEGTMTGKPGDWLITGVKGEQYPCDDEIFRMSYDYDKSMLTYAEQLAVSCGRCGVSRGEHEESSVKHLGCTQWVWRPE